MQVAGYYLGEEGPLIRAMETWTCHINRFEWQYDNTFAGKPLFGADLVDRTNKRVQVSLHLCNTTCLDGVDMGALS